MTMNTGRSMRGARASGARWGCGCRACRHRRYDARRARAGIGDDEDVVVHGLDEEGAIGQAHTVGRGANRGGGLALEDGVRRESRRCCRRTGPTRCARPRRTGSNASRNASTESGALRSMSRSSESYASFSSHGDTTAGRFTSSVIDRGLGAVDRHRDRRPMGLVDRTPERRRCPRCRSRGASAGASPG